jgi:DNA-binding response OmpR family regulator
MNNKIVLVVDDDEDLLKSLGIRLGKAGYKVLAAMDALQAVMMAHKHTPDLLVLDISMPAGSGITVMDRLSMSSNTKLIPIIILTASDDKTIQEQAEERGALHYFVKPYDFEELIAAINNALGVSG